MGRSLPPPSSSPSRFRTRRGGRETGDLCAQNEGVHFKPDAYAYTVQRSWSNASAAAGKDPCVPGRPGVYFNAAPVVTDMVTVQDKTGSVRVKGVQIPSGQSK